jgi:hypothetical protein
MVPSMTAVIKRASMKPARRVVRGVVDMVFSPGWGHCGLMESDCRRVVPRPRGVCDEMRMRATAHGKSLRGWKEKVPIAQLEFASRAKRGRGKGCNRVPNTSQ